MIRHHHVGFYGCGRLAIDKDNREVCLLEGVKSLIEARASRLPNDRSGNRWVANEGVNEIELGLFNYFSSLVGGSAIDE